MNSNFVKKLFLALLSEKLLLIMVGMVVIMSFLSETFITPLNIINILSQISVYGIIALGMTFVIICAQMDLSVGSVMAFGGLFFAILLPHTGTALAIVVSLLTCLSIGIVIGVLVSRVDINSLIVTLGAMVIIKGVALTISDGKPIPVKDTAVLQISNAELLGIPLLVFYMMVLLVIAEFVLQKTMFGRNVYATGANEGVARTTGIATPIYKTSVFAICSTLAGLSGILLTAKLGTSSPIMGDDAPMSVISSIVIGGTSLSGGKGNAVKTMMGVLFFGLLLNSLELLGIYPYIQMAVKGAFLIAIVASDKLRKEKKVVKKQQSVLLQS